ncbi:chemotaxis protein CheW [Xanthomonas sp. NCPPB 2632]|uniref:chemotaxis protein CheW n=1 Tax=Xanthomonas sp. NCPPB 2632 TaxID=3240912 RepID=UPI00351165DF
MHHPLPDVAPDARHDVQLFGTFHLGEFELALPIDTLQEVVGFPQAITRVPMAPDYVAGLFMLRGMMIPVLHLGRYLGLPVSIEQGESRVAVIESNGALLGIGFDRTGDMLRMAGTQIVPFQRDNGAASLIEGAFHLDDRIVQMLSSEALVHLPGIPRTVSTHLARQAREQRAANRIRKAISFHVDARPMALPMEAIHEIVRLPTLEHSVLSDAVCLGWLDLRGRPVPVLDLAAFLGLDSCATTPPQVSDFEDARRVVVLRNDAFYLGLLVDNIDSIVSYTDRELLPMPAMRGQTGVFTSCINRRDADASADADDLIMIDTAALFADAHLAHLAKGHHDLYLVADDQTRRTEIRRKRVRETWLTFRLDRLMAVRIDEVSEVIESHDALVRPPGTPAHVSGVLNVGKALIAVIDLRSHYGMGPMQDVEQRKILVVRHEGHTYGLEVDSVESIISIDPAEKITVPSLVATHMDAELRKDMHQVVESSEHGTVLLVDTLSLMRRLTGNDEPTAGTEDAPENATPSMA